MKIQLKLQKLIVNSRRRKERFFKQAQQKLREHQQAGVSGNIREEQRKLALKTS